MQECELPPPPIIGSNERCPLDEQLYQLALSFSSEFVEIYELIKANPQECNNHFKMLNYSFSQRPSHACAKIFSANFRAFRCYDCQQSQNSCLCAQCFAAGNHVGHTYIEYTTSGGGCCDCGSEQAWDEKGFCEAHAKKEDKSQLKAEDVEVKKKFYKETQFLLYLLLHSETDEFLSVNIKTHKYALRLLQYLTEKNKDNLNAMEATCEVFLTNFGAEYPLIDKFEMKNKTLLEIMFDLTREDTIDKFIKLTFALYPIVKFRNQIVKEYFKKMSHPNKPFHSKIPIRNLNYQFLTGAIGISRMAKNKQIPPFWPAFKGYANFKQASDHFQTAMADIKYIIQMKGSKDFAYSILSQMNVAEMPYFMQMTQLPQQYVSNVLEEIYNKTMIRILRKVKNQKDLIQKCLRELYASIAKEHKANQIYFINQKMFALFLFAYFDGELSALSNEQNFLHLCAIVNETKENFCMKLQLLIYNSIKLQLFEINNSIDHKNDMIYSLQYTLRYAYKERFICESLDLLYKKILIILSSYSQNQGLFSQQIQKVLANKSQIQKQKKKKKSSMEIQDSDQEQEQNQDEDEDSNKIHQINLAFQFQRAARINIDILIIAMDLNIDKKEDVFGFYKSLLALMPKCPIKIFKATIEDIFPKNQYFEEFAKNQITLERGIAKHFAKNLVPLNYKYYQQKFNGLEDTFQVQFIRNQKKSIGFPQEKYMLPFSNNDINDILKNYEEKIRKEFDFLKNMRQAEQKSSQDKCEQIPTKKESSAQSFTSSLENGNLMNLFRALTNRRANEGEGISPEIEELLNSFRNQEQNQLDEGNERSNLHSTQNKINKFEKNFYSNLNENLEKIMIFFENYPNSKIRQFIRVDLESIYPQEEREKHKMNKELKLEIELVNKSSEEIIQQKQELKEKEKDAAKLQREKLLKAKKAKNLKIHDGQDKALEKYKKQVDELEANELIESSLHSCIVCRGDDKKELFYMFYFQKSNIYEKSLLNQKGHHLSFKSCGHKIHQPCYQKSVRNNQVVRCFLCKAEVKFLMPLFSQMISLKQAQDKEKLKQISQKMEIELKESDEIVQEKEEKGLENISFEVLIKESRNEEEFLDERMFEKIRQSQEERIDIKFSQEKFSEMDEKQEIKKDTALSRAQETLLTIYAINEFGFDIQKEKEEQQQKMNEERCDIDIYRLIFESIVKETLMYAFSTPSYYANKLYPIHIELLSALKIIVEGKLKPIHQIYVVNQDEIIQEKTSFVQNVCLLEKMLAKFISLKLEASSQQQSTQEKWFLLPTEWKNSIELFIQCFKDNNSESFSKIIEIRDIKDKLAFLSIERDLCELHNLMGKCEMCPNVTNAIYMCMLCGFKACPQCQKQIKKHSKTQHCNDNIMIRTDNGIIYYFHNERISRKEHSIYEDYLGEPFKLQYESLKPKKYLKNEVQLAKIHRAWLESRIGQLPSN